MRPKQAATCPADDDWLELFRLAIDMLAAAERRASGRDRLTLTGMVVYAHATLGEMWAERGKVTEYLRTDEHGSVRRDAVREQHHRNGYAQGNDQRPERTGLEAERPSYNPQGGERPRRGQNVDCQASGQHVSARAPSE